MKSQAVRALDVALLGPLLLFTATRRELPGRSRVFFALAGAATVAYNLRNYLDLVHLDRLVELDPNAQSVRLLDVFVLGPSMVWAAGRDGLPEVARAGLAIGGALTITNNAAAYVRRARSS